MKLILILVSIIKKIQFDKNGQQYILYCYISYIIYILLNTVQQEKLIKKVILTEIFNCTFIRINTSKKNSDVDYEASRIQTFISQFKYNKNKKPEDEIEKLKLQLANLGVDYC